MNEYTEDEVRKLNLLMTQKKGWLVVHEISSIKFKKRLESYGLFENKSFYNTAIDLKGYRIVISDERIVALPHHLCRGIIC